MKFTPFLFCVVILVSCTKQEATRPVDIQKPDVPLLREIALAAIANRAPSLQRDRLEYDHTLYSLYRDHMFQETNEVFSVEFTVKTSPRKVRRDGEDVFEADSVSVTIQPDGQVDKGGVSSNVTRYLTADLDPTKYRGGRGVPIRGPPFFPVPLDKPLPKPTRAQVESIALGAISRFLPSIKAEHLEFDSLSFFQGTLPGATGIVSSYSITFWLANTVQERKTRTSVTIEGQEVAVQIQPDGRIREQDVRKQPLKFTLNRQALEEVEAKR